MVLSDTQDGTMSTQAFFFVLSHRIFLGDMLIMLLYLDIFPAKKMGLLKISHRKLNFEQL